MSSLATLGCTSKHLRQSPFDIEVIDGDTIKLNGQSLRLFGIDTPELHNQADNFRLTTGLEYFYALSAKRFTRHFVTHKSFTWTTHGHGYYGRTLVKIKTNLDLGLTLVKAGLARVAYISLNPKNPFFTRDTTYYYQLLKNQYFAFTHHRGFWSDLTQFKTIFPKASTLGF